jgi:YVTN family beta-propeller protein
MRLVTQIGGRINPKSVEASQTGLIFAQNNIYRHTISVYDRDFELVKTLKDDLVLADWGYPQYPDPVRGGPVEAAFSPDGRFAYITHRSMYGPGFPRPGPLTDPCSPASDIDRSFVVEYDVETLLKTRVFRVGSLPKDLTITPDGTRLLVSNWCSYDLSIIDLASGEETDRIDTGPYPRGIAVDPTSSFAYVAHLGSNHIARVDLESGRIRDIRDVGPSPRDVLMSPDGRFLYVSLDQGGGVAKVDVAEERVVKRVATGPEPRSMAMAPDGRSIYVVHWGGGTASKIRTRDMKVLQTVDTGYHPIGIAYDNATRQVWVSTYPGTIRIFQDE